VNRVVLAVCMLIVGLVAFFGLYVFLKGARRVQLAIASAKWPIVPGKVVSSETTRDVSTYRRSASVTFNTETVISYNVNGQDYVTDTLRIGQALGSGDKLDAVLQRLRYPAGKDVTVAYDPANPVNAVMKPGLHAEAFWLPGAGLAFLLPAALCLYLLPGMFRSTNYDEAFAQSVEMAIQQRRPDLVPPPPRQSTDKTMPIAAATFGAVFACLGILALTAGLQRAWQGSASQSWPRVPGVVIQTGLDEENDTTDAAYKARLIYKYDVKGTTHFNNVRSFAQVESGPHYKTGDHVKVSYLPADPDMAVIEPGNSGDTLWLPGIGLVLLLLSMVAFIWVVPAVGA
jgi:Protein of unknown function (DUF3592)